MKLTDGDPPTFSVALLPSLLPTDWPSARPTLAIVIDTLRFTSTACVALANGAQRVTVCSQVNQAMQLAGGMLPRPLLCGERHCVRIPGFDLGNSPSEYAAAAVGGRALVFSTTNGTLAVDAVRSAEQVVLGSLLNRVAVVDWLCRWHTRLSSTVPAFPKGPAVIWLVCAGTDGHVALEDVLTAGAILEGLQDRFAQTASNDEALLALRAWRSIDSASSLAAQLNKARGGRNLIEAGFAKDLAAVAELDSLNVVPQRIAADPWATFALVGA